MVKEHEGPVLSDEGKLTCYWGKDNKCKHFGIHDFHYFYCAAQESECLSKDYPWPGAGKQLARSTPDSGCPFLGPWEPGIEIGEECMKRRALQVVWKEIASCEEDSQNEELPPGYRSAQKHLAEIYRLLRKKIEAL